MALRKGLPAKLANTDAGDTRYDFNNLVVANTAGVPWGGVTSPIGPTVLSATATMNVTVAAFAGVAVRDGGVVLLASDGPVSVTLDPAPPSNSRIDVVTARQNDSSSTVSVPDGNDSPVFVVIKGTAAALPVRPAVPAGSLDLGSVLVPATATATNSAGVVISGPARYTCAPGGAVPFRTRSDMNVWTTGSDWGSPQVGQHATVFADPTAGSNGDYVYSGSQWLGGSVAPITTPGTGFSLGTAPNAPRILRQGSRRTLYGEVTFGGAGSGSSYANILTVPAIDQPPTTSGRTIGVGSVYTAGAGSSTLVLARMTLTAGVVGFTVSSASAPAGTVHLSGLTWLMD